MLEPYIREGGGFSSPVVRREAVDEAHDILQTQDHVIGYDTEGQARHVQADLLQRFDIRTEVIASVGPTVQQPRGRIEAEQIRRMDLEPGVRYVSWGVHKVQPELVPVA